MGLQSLRCINIPAGRGLPNENDSHFRRGRRVSAKRAARALPTPHGPQQRLPRRGPGPVHAGETPRWPVSTGHCWTRLIARCDGVYIVLVEWGFIGTTILWATCFDIYRDLGLGCPVARLYDVWIETPSPPGVEVSVGHCVPHASLMTWAGSEERTATLSHIEAE